MAVRVINGFPQHFDYSLLSSSYSGTIATARAASNIIDLSRDCIGDIILVSEKDRGQLTVIRDGAVLLEGAGYQWVAENTLQVSPGLLSSEKILFKFMTGSGMPSQKIEIKDPIQTASKIRIRKIKAIVQTDNAVPPSGANAPYVEAGRTRIKTNFELTDFDVFINGEMVTEENSDNFGIPYWRKVESDILELNTNYSTTPMQVLIINSDFYFQD